MNFISLRFLLFFVILFTVYYITPKKFRYAVIFVGSYVFYGAFSLKYLIILGATTLLTYVGGIALEKKKSRGVYALFLILNISILVVFKYTNFAIANINKLFSTDIAALNLILPVGLSFYIFMSTTYLSDIYRKDFKAERNVIRYAAFVAFFPSILSGPINKSRNLLPQLKEPRDFDADRAIAGFILFSWGLFEKTMVSNRLLVIIDRVYNDYQSYTGAYLLIAAICFSLYIYADFSSYSDMARGISKMLNIEIDRNFNNPYISTSTGEFWNRWHSSLNEWFVEIVYIPLGGNRKGVLRKYLNVMIVFFISGLWHGAAWNFIAWGVINGIFVVIGQILKKPKSRFYEKIQVDEKCTSIRFIRQVIVFMLITITWVFFRNGIHESLYIIRHMLIFTPSRLLNPDLLNLGGDTAKTFITMLGLGIFTAVQIARKDESGKYALFKKQPVFLQTLLIALVLCIGIYASFSGSTEQNTQFLYFKF
ncbi:MAG: MBOAT family protein [Lachnospiraceae bacterium]|nr:MBOAT family protein [Lachnospiraceae bacterium]